MARCEGLVAYFNRSKGYGFIVPFGQRDQIFVHGADIETDRQVLSEGQTVSFTLELAAHRWEARQVRP
ncbi:cold shock domain-containing protein [Streptomyces sp. NBC_00237]|uniref:cold shock domain-containing protein n=1 Tax=Streptomyces sp. NBC_00237 TaxID=2975687 RepID=UPI002259092F|nr:cold shock domain-containing protein [Streptomyces sp. NBC_00237]MCX5205908.1 cold shock domain-containing protein [Streptomyces sp. NBC_00237]